MENYARLVKTPVEHIIIQGYSFGNQGVEIWYSQNFNNYKRQHTTF